MPPYSGQGCPSTARINPEAVCLRRTEFGKKSRPRRELFPDLDAFISVFDTGRLRSVTSFSGAQMETHPLPTCLGFFSRPLRRRKTEPTVFLAHRIGRGRKNSYAIQRAATSSRESLATHAVAPAQQMMPRQVFDIGVRFIERPGRSDQQRTGCDL